MLFIELQYTLATEEAERIGVDHVARMSTADTGESSTGRLRRLQKHAHSIYQGPVVQNFVSLTSSLRPQLIK